MTLQKYGYGKIQTGFSFSLNGLRLIGILVNCFTASENVGARNLIGQMTHIVGYLGM